jgi:hypothetical protein
MLSMFEEKTMNLDNIIGQTVTIKNSNLCGKLLLQRRVGNMSIYNVGKLKFPEWKVLRIYLNRHNDFTLELLNLTDNLE